jgi:hypothetical protein
MLEEELFGHHPSHSYLCGAEAAATRQFLRLRQAQSVETARLMQA